MTEEDSSFQERMSFLSRDPLYPGDKLGTYAVTAKFTWKADQQDNQEINQ